MLDLSENENPIEELFEDLTKNQKMSIMNLLMTLSVCDGQNVSDSEIVIMNTYRRIFCVKNYECMDYQKNNGHLRIIDDLKFLKKDQKDFLVIAAFEMITCKGRPSDLKLKVTHGIFDKLGMNDEAVGKALEKIVAIRKHFFGQ